MHSPIDVLVSLTFLYRLHVKRNFFLICLYVCIQEDPVTKSLRCAKPFHLGILYMISPVQAGKRAHLFNRHVQVSKFRNWKPKKLLSTNNVIPLLFVHLQRKTASLHRRRTIPSPPISACVCFILGRQHGDVLHITSPLLYCMTANLEQKLKSFKTLHGDTGFQVWYHWPCIDPISPALKSCVIHMRY